MSHELILQLGETLTQTLAFLIFFWIMKMFAWPALTKVLDERRKQIEDGFAQIERKQAEADEAHKRYEEHLRNIEAEARQKMQEAVNEGRRVASEIGDSAREEARKLAERAQRNIRIEMDKARVELRGEIVQMTLAASERLMREKLDPEAHRRQIEQFLADLETRN